MTEPGIEITTNHLKVVDFEGPSFVDGSLALVLRRVADYLDELRRAATDADPDATPLVVENLVCSYNEELAAYSIRLVMS